MSLLRSAILASADLGYRAARPLIFRQSAQAAHERVLGWLAWADERSQMHNLARALRNNTTQTEHITYGGVEFDQSLILAAGFVKGDGFASEDEAIEAVSSRHNIIPGWRIMPLLVGPVEFGSFTRYPRVGNLGTVMWRDAATRSTQNRIGLKNPGARAAAAFLAQHHATLPPIFGINIAVTPGLTDIVEEGQHISESIAAFLAVGVIPSWFTLNLSCPNTEDDPTGNQTAAKTCHLCNAALTAIADHNADVPLWIKVGPDLSEQQYRLLMCISAELGVRAVIATNTLGQPAPTTPVQTAGVGGGALHSYALQAAQWLQAEKVRHDYPVDVVGCGGVLDGESRDAYHKVNIRIAQYWSALVYRGPLAAALIESERS